MGKNVSCSKIVEKKCSVIVSHDNVPIVSVIMQVLLPKKIVENAV